MSKKRKTLGLAESVDGVIYRIKWSGRLYTRRDDPNIESSLLAGAYLSTFCSSIFRIATRESEVGATRCREIREKAGFSLHLVAAASYAWQGNAGHIRY